MTLSVHDTFQDFRRIRSEITLERDCVVADGTLREGAVLGIGILLGGGFPGSAASVSLLLERQFPDVDAWPWLPGAEA